MLYEKTIEGSPSAVPFTEIKNVSKGEAFSILLVARDYNGAVVESPESQDVYMTFSSTDGGSIEQEASLAGGQVSLVSAVNGEWRIDLSRAFLTPFMENIGKFFNIWTELSGNAPIVQAKGRLILLPSIERIPSEPNPSVTTFDNSATTFDSTSETFDEAA